VAMGLGGLAFLAGRSGSRLCAPDRVLQPHGMWHVLAAGACGAYAYAVTDV
jgi:hypothetical protein